MNSIALKTGKVVVSKVDRLSFKFVNVLQDAASFHGRYSQSPDGVFMVVYEDGHAERDENQEKWVNGQVCLVRNDDELLWIKELERPNDCVVSNSGVTVVEDWLRTKKSLGGKILIFDSKGDLILEKQCESNLAACAISGDGKFAAFSTAVPDNGIYFVEVASGTILWRFTNTARRVALELSFSQENEILVSTGQTGENRSLSYKLTLNGFLSSDSAQELNKIQQITNGNSPSSTELLLEFLLSTDPSKISKGLETLQSVLYRKNMLDYQKIVASLLSIIENTSNELSKPAVKIILAIGKKSPALIEPFLQKIVTKCREWLNTPYESENGLMTLGELGALNTNWAVMVLPLIMDRLQGSDAWNERRFAAFAIGQIGKAHPELAKEAVPILARYLGDPTWWLSALKKTSKETFSAEGVSFSISIEDGINPEVWMRDAAIGVLGDIGAECPDMVKDCIPLIALCLQRKEPYTRKRTLTALGQIAQRDAKYIGPIVPIIERIAEQETDPKVKSEARRILETLSPQAAERSVANVSNLLANLSSANMLIRYKSIQELERMAYSYSATLPQEYLHQVLFSLSKSSNLLSECIKRIREEIEVTNEEELKWLLMESLVMAKRTFLDFIVGEYQENGVLRCRLCNREFSRGGIRNHLSKSHPETWQLVRPYNDETLQYMNMKNQSGLSYEEWEGKLLQRFSQS